MSLISTNKKKFAVVIGINYVGTSNALQGCIPDAQHLQSFLLKNHYLPQNIHMMTDNGPVLPTKQNILASFNILLQKAKEGFTELWFSYSGHGSYMRDTNKDESDGRDELLCPVDFATKGFISDDDIHTLLVSKLPINVTLLSLIDACHSGSIFDLPYLYTQTLITNNSKKCPCKCITISGCTDAQTSADAYINNRYEGAMTWAFLQVMEQHKGPLSLCNLIIKMRELLKAKYTQIPQLAMNSPAMLYQILI